MQLSVQAPSELISSLLAWRFSPKGRSHQLRLRALIQCIKRSMGGIDSGGEVSVSVKLERQDQLHVKASFLGEGYESDCASAHLQLPLSLSTALLWFGLPVHTSIASKRFFFQVPHNA